MTKDVKYYQINECSDLEHIIKMLNKFEDKLFYKIIDDDYLKLVDNYLSNSEVKKIKKEFDSYDVIEHFGEFDEIREIYDDEDTDMIEFIDDYYEWGEKSDEYNEY